MTTFLLDTNLLVSLLWPSHDKHTLSMDWFTRHRAQGWATCPITQLGFIRIISNPSFSSDAVLPTEAALALAANTAASDHDFWPDDASFEEAGAFTGARLIGHQQVTDAYLLGLALRRGGRLATLDLRIAVLTAPNSVEGKALEVVA